MTLPSATARLSRQMPEAEAAIENALVASAELLLTAAAARRDTGDRRVEGHAALLRISKLNHTLIEASGEASRAHRELRKLSEAITAGPDENDCPEGDGLAPSGIVVAA